MQMVRWVSLQYNVPGKVMGASELKTFKLLWIKHWGMEYKEQPKSAACKLTAHFPLLSSSLPKDRQVPPAPGHWVSSAGLFPAQPWGCRQTGRMDRGTDLCCWFTFDEWVPTPAMATAGTKRSGQQCHCCRIERRAWGVIAPLLSHIWLPVTRVSLSLTPSAVSQTHLRHGTTNTHRASVLWVPLLPSKGRRAWPWGMGAVCLWVNNPMKIHKKKMRASSQALAITSPYRSCLWWFGMCYRDWCVSLSSPGPLAQEDARPIAFSAWRL